MIVAVDASVVVAALVDTGSDGRWAESWLRAGRLVAPHLLPAEVASVLRRAEGSQHLSSDTAALAFADLGSLRLALYPFAPFSARVWELRGAVTPYDAWYVAVAEELGAPLVTLDHRLNQASGPTCTIVTPPEPPPLS